MNEDLQLNVQRLLGRCMLRMQHYERLMKAILAEHELAGPVDTLAAQRVARLENVSDKSLGTLVESLFQSCVVPEGFERELLSNDNTPTDKVSMAFSVRLSLQRESWITAKAAVKELVGLRNRMVHHLVDDFELSSDSGCIDASRYLKEGFDRIERHYEELTEWAKGMVAVREAASAFCHTDAFSESLLNGIEPDGSFNWPNAGIVRALRQAARQLSVDGWTKLTDAEQWMEEHQPEQTPAKYGCRTLPQVLSESRQFDLQYRLLDGCKVAWFRHRAC